MDERVYADSCASSAFTSACAPGLSIEPDAPPLDALGKLRDAPSTADLSKTRGRHLENY